MQFRQLGIIPILKPVDIQTLAKLIVGRLDSILCERGALIDNVLEEEGCHTSLCVSVNNSLAELDNDVTANLKQTPFFYFTCFCSKGSLNTIFI